MLPLPAQSVLDLIGQPPVLQLNRVQRILGLRGRLLAKLEHLNPGGSKKDRVALSIIRAAREDRRLAPPSRCWKSPAEIRGRASPSSAEPWGIHFSPS